MIPDATKRPGRPRTSSRALIEDAATELFLERTFAATSIDDIAQRAGVSRSTFFNYFESKSDLLFVELDLAIDALARELSAASEPRAMDAVRAAIERAVVGIGSDRVPLALTQDDVMGTREETRSAGLLRYARRADIVAAFLAGRAGVGRNDLLVQAASSAISGAMSAAWAAWAADGIGREALAVYVGRALDTVYLGLDRALEPSDHIES